VFAVAAGVDVLHMLNHLQLCRYHLQFCACLRTHFVELVGTLRADLRLFGKGVMDLLCWQPFKSDATFAARLLSLVRADSLELRLRLFGLCLGFNFVEDHLELAGNRSLTRGAEAALLSKTKLLFEKLQTSEQLLVLLNKGRILLLKSSAVAMQFFEEIGSFHTLPIRAGRGGFLLVLQV